MTQKLSSEKFFFDRQLFIAYFWPKTAVLTITLTENIFAPLASILNGKNLRLEELNFLTGQLIQLDNTEEQIFYTVAYTEKTGNLPSLINLCFNLHCYTLAFLTFPRFFNYGVFTVLRNI